MKGCTNFVPLPRFTAAVQSVLCTPSDHCVNIGPRWHSALGRLDLSLPLRRKQGGCISMVKEPNQFFIFFFLFIHRFLLEPNFVAVEQVTDDVTGLTGGSQPCGPSSSLGCLSSSNSFPRLTPAHFSKIHPRLPVQKAVDGDLAWTDARLM